MARLFILIFALNALFTPVSAMGVCEMMDGSSAMMTSSTSSMSDAMADMDCEMDADTACCSTECASNCSVTVASQMSSEKQTSIIVAGHHQPRAGFAYFYKITYPVNTPPPLV